MQHRLVVVMVVGLWAIMMGSLVRRWLLERRPETLPGTYRSVLTPERQNYHSRMGIYLAGHEKKVGYTETVFYYGDDKKYRISNVTRLQAAAPGVLARLAAFGLESHVVVDAGYALERFSVLLSSSVLHAECKGEVRGTDLVVRVRVAGEEEHVRRFPLPPGATMASGLSPLLALPPLRVGLRWRAMVMNPLTLEPTEVELEVLRREPLEWAGETWDTHVVEVRSGYVSARAWVSRNGEVLKETTLFGLTLIKEQVLDGDEALPKVESSKPKARGGKKLKVGDPGDGNAG